MATTMIDQPAAERALQASTREHPTSNVGSAQRAVARPKMHAELRRDSRPRATVQIKQKPIPPPRMEVIRESRELTQVEEHRQAGFRFSLPMLFILFGYVVGAGLVIICGLDLLFAIPFSRVNLVFDIGFFVSGALLIYLSWDARDGCP